MIEIALCLAIIGIALVAIIGVLPMGMNVQKDNREETVINQDATVLMNAIRNGAHGLNDLTNYVYSITNSWTHFNSGGQEIGFGLNSYTNNGAIVNGSPVNYMALTNGANIIGLLSTPQFTDSYGNPVNNASGLEYIPGNGFTNVDFYSNHIVAYVHSISGPAVEKPPQDNPLLQQDSFSYRLICVNAPLAADTNYVAMTNGFSQQLAANLHEVRLRFSYPLNPNGRVGAGDHNFRTLVGGQITQTNFNGQPLYFYQPQSFVQTP